MTNFLVKATKEKPVEEIKPENGKTFSLEEINKYLEGDFEIVHMFPGKLMLVNEEAGIKGLPQNEVASLLAYGTILGNAMVVDTETIA